MKAQYEQQIQKRLIQYLRIKHRIFCWKTTQTGVWDPKRGFFRKNNSPIYVKGIADILGITKSGIFVAFEIKRDIKSASATPQQKAFLLDIIEYGGIAGLARKEADIDNVMNIYASGDKHALKWLVIGKN